MITRLTTNWLIFAFCAGSVFGGDLSVASIFSDQMVLQRQTSVPVWGWADVDQTVTLEFHGQKKTATADSTGAWRVHLDPMPTVAVGEPLVVTCAGQVRAFQNVVVGEVWFAGGQSNMAFTMKGMAKHLPEGREMVGKASFPLIRVRRVQGDDQPTPQKDLSDGSQWGPCTPESVQRFSAVAYVFAKRLHRELGVPVGIINCSWGGKPIEPFIPIDHMAGHPTLTRLAELARSEDQDAIRNLPGGTFVRSTAWYAGRIYNSRIAPVAPYSVRGAIWYQGESNSGTGEDPRDYAHKMRALIRGWRDAWKNPQLPIYSVQLPQWKSYAWTYLREQQQRALDVPHTGMVVTIDLDNHDDIHPPNKIPVGERLARWALARQYGRSVSVSGPVYRSVEIGDDQVIVGFENAEDGLLVGRVDGSAKFVAETAGELGGFELADKDSAWHSANARIAGSHVIVRSPRVPNPTAVRYACRPEAAVGEAWNLYGANSLPVAPFCSDWSRMPYDAAKNPMPEHD